MNSKTWTHIIALTLFAALAIPVRLPAQQRIRYTVTDLGTLGGPKYAELGSGRGVSAKDAATPELFMAIWSCWFLAEREKR